MFVNKQNLSIEVPNFWLKESLSLSLSSSSLTDQKTTQAWTYSIGMSPVKKNYLHPTTRIKYELNSAKDCKNPNQVCLILNSELNSLSQEEWHKLESDFESLLKWAVTNFHSQVITDLLAYKNFFSSNFVEKLNQVLIDSCYIQSKECTLAILENDRVNPSFNGNEALLAALVTKSFLTISSLLNHKNFDLSCNILHLKSTIEIYKANDKICSTLLEKIDKTLEINKKSETNDLEDGNKSINSCDLDFDSDPDKVTQFDLEI